MCGSIWAYIQVKKKFTTLTLTVCDACWHFPLSFIKNKPKILVSWPISGFPVWSENIVLCMAEEIAEVDGKKRHFGLLRSNLPSCLYRRIEIMVLFRTNFQLFCSRVHSSIWNAFAVCQILGSNHFCSNTISKTSGHFSKSLWQLKQWNNKINRMMKARKLIPIIISRSIAEMRKKRLSSITQ